MSTARNVSDRRTPARDTPDEGPLIVPSRTWIVAPTGRDEGDGSLAKPWSFAYAASGASGRISPGDTVWLRGGVYRSKSGITISFSGAPARPVTWKAAPGEHFELDGAITEFVDTPGTAWEPVEVRNGHNLYRSTSLYPKSFMYGGFIEIDGHWLPLATHDHANGFDWIRSDYHNWRHPEPYYLGPGICYVPDSPTHGRLYIRLDNSTPEAQCSRNVAQIKNPDPRCHALRIPLGESFGLSVNGSHHVFEGFTDIHNYHGGFYLHGTVSDLTLRRVGGRVSYFGGRLGAVSDVLIEDPSFDGCMDPERWWISWIDVKGGDQPADHVRKCGLVYEGSHNVEVAGGYFHDFFDSVLAAEGAHHIEVHGVEFRTWDDAWQMIGSLHDIDLHHNTYLGAGPSRDDTDTGLANPAPGTLWIHDNIIDTTRYRIFYYRFGRPEDPAGIGWREPIPFSSHGMPTAGMRTIPWKVYQNTIVTGITGIRSASGYVGLGQFGSPTAIVEAPHEVYNNIILVRDGRSLGAYTWVNTGAEIYDGNVYWGWTDRLTPSGYRSIWRYLNRSAGQFDGEKNSLADVAKLRELARQDSKVYYPPGWEAAGLSVDPKLDANYKPLNPAIAVGAVDLTATRWPGTKEYKRWRGAVQP